MPNTLLSGAAVYVVRFDCADYGQGISGVFATLDRARECIARDHAAYYTDVLTDAQHRPSIPPLVKERAPGLGYGYIETYTTPDGNDAYTIHAATIDSED